ncbi:hypothetical protein FGG78_22805 [Thioclava sp. BHET1]|nr:hypothetical protein FGG78_22805 [Thioclava sp. BHET1]
MTEEGPLPPAQMALDAAEVLLGDRATELKLEIRKMPQYAERVFAGGGESTSARLEVNDLPAHARGLQIDRYAIVLALMPEAPSEEGVGDTVRRARNQCVVARSYLSSSATVDLHAILLGPRGSEGSDAWRALALIAERDERVARKLVWLRPEDPGADEASFAEFTQRTFLARPWVTDAVFSMAPLDNISRAAAAGEVPRDTASTWIQLASGADEEGDRDSDAMVDAMIAAWRQRGSK